MSLRPGRKLCLLGFFNFEKGISHENPFPHIRDPRNIYSESSFTLKNHRFPQNHTGRKATRLWRNVALSERFHRFFETAGKQITSY
jgi:hypothetical protein